MGGVIVDRPVEEVLISYLSDFNISQTAQRMGMSSSSVRNIINTNRNALDELQQARQLRAKVDADYVLSSLKELNETDIGDVFNDDGSLKPISDWSPVLRRGISSLSVKEQVDDGGALVGRVVNVKLPDKLKTLELMGKHIAVKAFSEQVEVSDNSDLATLMARRMLRLEAIDTDSIGSDKGDDNG